LGLGLYVAESEGSRFLVTVC